VYSGLLFWNIFSNSLSNASQSLLSSSNIIQKVYLPRILLPAASVAVTLVDFFFAFLVFVGILIYYGFMPNFTGFLLIIPLLLVTMIASLGVGLYLAALNVKYRDVRYALPFFIQILIFITPVIYPIAIVSQRYRLWLALNPMTGVIETFKSVLLSTSSVNWITLLISVAASVVCLLFGMWYFLKTEKTFADII
jgi:lipopolysaccharide transport system permease protein